MSGLLSLTFLALIQCGHDVEGFVSQLKIVQPGISTSLECNIKVDTHFHLFWIKIPPDSIPVCIATAKTFSSDVKMCEEFENHPRIKATWNQEIFNLSFSSVDQTDIATYFCGTSNYGEYLFGNGSKLVFKEHTDEIIDNEDKDFVSGKTSVLGYTVVALAAINIASLLLIVGLCHVLRRKRSGELQDVGDDNTDEVNYTALSFHNKQRRTVEQRTSMGVIYGAVRHQEEL